MRPNPHPVGSPAWRDFEFTPERIGERANAGVAVSIASGHMGPPPATAEVLGSPYAWSSAGAAESSVLDESPRPQ